MVSNVEALPNSDGGRVRDLLVAQVCAPVRWEESVVKMAELGVKRAIEIGPGKVLSGLIRRITPEMRVLNVEDRASLRTALEALR